MISLKKVLKKLIYQEKADSESYIKYLRRQGASVGERVNIYAPNRILIDMSRPWLIDIGDDVQITEDVTILTHGYDWAVLKGVYGEVLGSSGRVKIGNNVFIGMKTTILKGVHIGNNVIIGANSLVNKDIPDNCVVVGNPAKVIMSLDQYYEKRKKEQLAEATELVQLYRERYGEDPDDKALHEFFWLFCDGTDELPDCWKSMMMLIGNEEYSYSKIRNNKKKFRNKDSFLKSVK